METDVPNTKERILEAARQLFHDHGFNATGVAAILEAADARSGTLYHFFPNKDALLLGVLDRYIDLLMPAVMEPAFAGVADPVERVFAVLARYREGLLLTNFNKGCPIGNLALEVADEKPEARAKIALNFANWCKAIERCFDEAADRLPRNLDRAALSRFVLTVMEGGMMLARAERNIAPFDAAVTQLRDYVERLMRKSDIGEPPKVLERPERETRGVAPSPSPSYRVW